MSDQVRLLRAPKVLERTGLSRATLYRKIKEGTFPAPRKISKRISAWRSDELEHWISVQ